MIKPIVDREATGDSGPRPAGREDSTRTGRPGNRPLKRNRSSVWSRCHDLRLAMEPDVPKDCPHRHQHKQSPIRDRCSINEPWLWFGRLRLDDRRLTGFIRYSTCRIGFTERRCCCHTKHECNRTEQNKQRFGRATESRLHWLTHYSQRSSKMGSLPTDTPVFANLTIG